MRKWNAILSMAILALFLLHAVVGGFQLMGLLPGGLNVMTVLAYVMLALIALHTLIGIKLTVDSLMAAKKAGVSYWKENRLFWARRISGFSIMALLFFHLTAFGDYSGAAYRLQWFDTAKLVTQLLLVAAIALHVISNVKPMLISFGIRSLKDRAGEILLILSVLLLFMAAAFIVYYIRWNSF